MLCVICGKDINAAGEDNLSLVCGKPVCESCAKDMSDEEWDELRREADEALFNEPAFDVRPYVYNEQSGDVEYWRLYDMGDPVLVFKYKRNAELVKDICIMDVIDKHHPACFSHKVITDDSFSFVYGRVVVGHRLHISRPIIHSELVLDKCIRMGIEHKVRNIAGDDYYEVQILYKDDNNKLQCGKYDLEYFDVTIEFLGDMQVHL